MTYGPIAPSLVETLPDGKKASPQNALATNATARRRRHRERISAWAV
ncbi:hypothetical protein WJ0W_002054 [Paenibacillus melissococcoides]|uniref:Uncharacterized protein n=1 Tax=Paenibacillus melissococcoides TaxID=2912268 RepID=A0ABM9G0V0_9BACL|nr:MULTISPECIES: hypothetical protein [Paenibacillus]MEB9893571.1 hypothetical protein [Bacillus cereus]CAH8244824.1 hypothetical protein WJ0W_002054 [Paenibacillus melissococcoides]CAH8709084.1 hypothetical protein WDD9_002136 [Paenibacillus melissococcoides]CAH8709840.1 hypothetical protein HTL2_002424 [Paenibacillus melissococcoides]